MKKKILIGILASIFILDVILILTNNISWFDNACYNVLISLKSTTFTNIVKVITDFSSTRMIIFLNALILIFVLIFKRTKLLIIPISSIISSVVNTLLKQIFRRARPIGIALVTEKSFSFPSGHTMISILFYGLILYLIYKHKVKGYRIISLILGIYIVSVGLSRIYLGVHYASDVVGGWCIGGIILIILTESYKKYNKE